LKVVAFSLIAVSLLYGSFSALRLYGGNSVASSMTIVAGEPGRYVESRIARCVFFLGAVF
jgi:hypothetical protein